LLADDPPETWQTVQRLTGLGYDWHNIMHMISALATEDFYRTIKEHRPPDPAGYARRLNELPGGWPPPEELGRVDSRRATVHAAPRRTRLVTAGSWPRREEAGVTGQLSSARTVLLSTTPWTAQVTAGPGDPAAPSSRAPRAVDC
jgi:hypothetical protein